MKHEIKKEIISTDVLEDARGLYQKNKTELDSYIDHLLEWNVKINLVSRVVSRETIREHVVHSLLPLSAGLLDSHDRWIDAGTGGGLPGLPLAICMKNTKWLLNDNIKKKMRAVDDIVKKMELNQIEILPKSISLVDLKKGTGLVTKHAFKIDDLLRLLGSKPWKTIIMWKGAKDAEKELIQSRKKLNATIFEFDFGKEESFYEGKGIVLIER